MISLGLPFGHVSNLLMLKTKNQVLDQGGSLQPLSRLSVLSLPPVSPQAFLEMNSEDAAGHMVGYYSTVMPVIRHQPVYVQFSNHKELKTDNSPNQEVVHPRLQAQPLAWPRP